MNQQSAIEPPLNLLIVGAGISGIGMAVHYARACPGKRFAILEKRTAIGGTWDLFRYPGIRSDSDMFTLSFDFHPWTAPDSIAGGESIRGYLEEVIEAHRLRDHIWLDQAMLAADWDSAAALWRVTTRTQDGTARAVTARFLYMATGYYDYESPHDAAIPGLDRFAGLTIHPQFWPETVDLDGKNVIVVGSGATAVTLVPALAERGARVTMLQRTPTWYLNRPRRDRLADLLRRVLPAGLAHRLVRMRNVRLQDLLFRMARNRPDNVAEMLTGQTRTLLGEAWDERAFTPPYRPWEQRLCLVPDADFFDAVRSGKASVVTGRIAEVEPDGIRLEDGRHLPADVIVTATGLRLSMMGKTAISIDGEPVDFSQRWYYRTAMFSNVPNFAALFGYLNASWTLRVDIVADWLTRLLRQMDAWGADVVVPHLPADHALVETFPVDMFSSGYLQRGRHLFPRCSDAEPWSFGMHYLADREIMRTAPFDDGVLRFTRAPDATDATAGVAGAAQLA